MPIPPGRTGTGSGAHHSWRRSPRATGRPPRWARSPSGAARRRPRRSTSRGTTGVSVFPAIADARRPASLPSGTIVAVFTDSRGPQAASSYTATVLWGDGRSSVARVSSLGGGAFAVLAGHTYGTRGTYTIRVKVQGVDSLTRSTRTGFGANPATVGPAPATVRAALRARRLAARQRNG